jgi:CTP:molybdopterin cytidylyltransferase MocA
MLDMRRKSPIIRCVVFAAGKSTRMASGRSKMLEPVRRDGQEKAMLLHTTELLSQLGYEILVLVGYDGTAVSERIAQEGKGQVLGCLRVSQDDASDLEPCTAGHLKKYTEAIVADLNDADNLLFCVGDQPFMQLDTIRDFVQRHLDAQVDASILLTDVRGTPMERSTSTRVSVIGSARLFFDTPPKDGPFESYSTLVDVGVVLMTRAAFLASVKEVVRTDVFSKLLCHLPPDHGRINTVRALNPYQFINVNVKDETSLDIPEPLFPPPPEPVPERFVDRSEILLRWLEWNMLDRRVSPFDVFAFPLTYSPEFEMDTTLLCRGTPACAADCTYRQKHMQVFMDPQKGQYIVERAKSLGFSAVLFSGGGENLENEAYDNFKRILTAAKRARLRTNLATNGMNLNHTRIEELIFLLDSIRFSIPPRVRNYSHIGILAPLINLARKLIADQYLSTKLYANCLMKPDTPPAEIEADILLLSQLGVDGIRFKGQHEWEDGRFLLHPDAYANHIRAITAIKQRTDIKRPEITISKLERMINAAVGARPFKACWYRDFNPLVIGCDAHNYACCEMKYEHDFDYGEVDPHGDNLKSLTTARREPQPVRPRLCFRGCKGYLLNMDLQVLLDEYERRGKSIFEHPTNVAARERILQNLCRTVLAN